MASAITFGPNLVSPNESIFYVDAANSFSYPGSGYVWKDLTKYQATGSFYSSSTGVSSPTFNPSNLGSIDLYGGLTNSSVIPNEFSGSMLVSAPNNFQNLLGTNFTVNTWVKPSSGLTNGYNSGVIVAYRWFDYSGGPVQNIIFQMQFTNPNIFYFIHGFNSTGNAIAVASGYAPDNWYNVVGVRNGTISSIYINGVLQNSAAVANGTSYTGPLTPYLTVGGLGYNTPDHPFAVYSGSIASVEIYNRVLSNDEILQNYNAVKKRFGLN